MVKKVFMLLGVLCVSLGLLAGWIGKWELTERPRFSYVVAGKLPGGNAPAVADAIARPVDHSFDQIPGVELVVSESYSDGTFDSRIFFNGEVDAARAEIYVQNGINESRVFLPNKVKELYYKLIVLKKDSKYVAIAIVSRRTDEDGTALQELGRSVLKRLIDEHALVNPRPLEKQLSEHGAPPALIIHVNELPAIRIAGLAPAGRAPQRAAAHCLALAESERMSRHDGQDFQLVTLAP